MTDYVRVQNGNGEKDEHLFDRNPYRLIRNLEKDTSKEYSIVYDFNGKLYTMAYWDFDKNDFSIPHERGKRENNGNYELKEREFKNSSGNLTNS